jgi:hypothetical protein
MSDLVVLTPRDAAELLGAALASLSAEVNVLPPAALHWHPAPGEWCVKEVLGHLIEAEQRGFAGRIRVILSSEGPTLATWEQAEVARERRDCERDVGRLLDELSTLRKESLTLVRELQPADLERVGHHPLVGDLRVGDLLHEWVHHDRNHLKQIMANVQAFVWPHMGNAQRFYES